MHYVRIIFLLFSATLFASCGGGGGSPGSSPNHPNLVTTAGDVLTIPTGAFREYAVSGGVPPYQVSSSEPAIAVGNINGSTLSIGALTGGKAFIRVFDNKGTVVATEVTVGSSIPLYTTAPSPLKVGVNVPRIFSIGGGSPPYTVEGGNASVAVVAQTDATHWSVVGKAIGGSDQVKIRDSAGSVVTVDLSTAAPELRISPSELTMPTGMEAEITVTGGQPPYTPAGNIPAAIQISPSSSTDGKFKIQGSLASTLDVTFGDAAGQSVKVKVTINTATVSFRLSPSPMMVSETGYEPLNFSIFGFYGDTGTGAASGDVCIYVSDPSYFALDPVRAQCSKFSSTSRTFTLNTGTRGNRCVSANKDIRVRAVDSKQQIADGVITILDNGTGCNTTGQLTLSPGSVTLDSGRAVDVLIQGGTGSYVATPANGAIVTAAVAGDVLTVTGRTTVGQTSVLVTDVGSGQTASLSVTNGTPLGFSVSPNSVKVSRDTFTYVQVLGGSGTYNAAVADSAIATVFMEGTRVSIIGARTLGITSVLVTDAVTGSTATISVTNESGTGDLTVTPASLLVSPGTSASVTVSGGSGNYAATPADSSIVDVRVGGDTVTVTGGLTRGATTVLVTDTVKRVTKSFNVTNGNAAGVLTVTPASLVVSPGTKASVTVSGGSGSYAATPGDSAIVGVDVIGNTVTVTGGARRGVTTVLVTDTVNASVTKSFSVTNGSAPSPLSVSPTSVAVSTGTSTDVQILGGSGAFTASSANAAIASATVAGSKVTILGGSTFGNTSVLVIDASTGLTATVSVTNGSPGAPISVLPTSVAVSTGKSSDVQILGGSGRFTASSANAAIASATVAGSKVTITGGTASGNTSVLVIDAATGLTATVSVTNGTAVVPISVLPTSVTVSNGKATDVQILGGSGTFTASSGNATIATAAVAGSKVTITGGTASGSTSVLVIDAVTGLTATVSVTNGAPAGPLTVSPTALFTTLDETATAIISGGSGQYGVSNVNTAFVRIASIDGNVLSVRGGVNVGTVNVVVYDLVTPSSSVVVTVNNAGTGVLTATPSSVTSLPVNGVASVVISGGSNSYVATSADATIATATISASTVTITGRKNGSTVLTVTDLSTGRTVNIGVTISSSLTVLPTTLTVAVLGNRDVTVNTGSGSYSAVSANLGIATVSVSGNTVTVTGAAAGTTTVTVTDSVYGSTTVFTVTVN